MGVHAVVKEIKSKNKKSELDQALADLETGNLIHYGTIKEFSKKIDRYFAPDGNLRNTITAEELLKRVHEDIRNKFATRI